MPPYAAHERFRAEMPPAFQSTSLSRAKPPHACSKDCEQSTPKVSHLGKWPKAATEK